MVRLVAIAAAATGCAGHVAPVGYGVTSSLPPRFAATVSVARDRDDLDHLGGMGNAIVPVDFARDHVAVLQGATSTWKSKIAVRKVAIDEGVASIDACVHGSVVQSLSAPWVAVTVPATVREVRWTCGGDVVATHRAPR